MEERLGLKALFYTFFLPFVVMIFVLFVIITLGGSDIIAALFAILSLFPYYTLLHMSKQKIEKDFIFTAEKTPQHGGLILRNM